MTNKTFSFDELPANARKQVRNMARQTLGLAMRQGDTMIHSTKQGVVSVVYRNTPAGQPDGFDILARSEKMGAFDKLGYRGGKVGAVDYMVKQLFIYSD
jgi:hypothetical protein